MVWVCGLVFIDFFEFDAYWFCVAGVVRSLFGSAGGWCCLVNVVLVCCFWCFVGSVCLVSFWFSVLWLCVWLDFAFSVFPGVGLVVVWSFLPGVILWV